MMTDGLKRRQTYEEVIDYIENDKDKIKYPDRTAKQLRNTFELSQLDGVGMQIMEQQQFREMKEREKEHLLRQIASKTNMSITDARATHTAETEENTTQFQSPQSITPLQTSNPPWMFPTGSRVLDSDTQFQTPPRQYPSIGTPFFQGAIGLACGVVDHFKVLLDNPTLIIYLMRLSKNNEILKK